MPPLKIQVDFSRFAKAFPAEPNASESLIGLQTTPSVTDIAQALEK